MTTSIHAAMSNAPDNATPPARTRSDETLAAVRRYFTAAEKAKARYEASLVTRDAAMQAAMDDGWTSDEVGEAIGTRGVNVRNLLSARRNNR